MLSTIYSSGVVGIDGYEIVVECCTWNRLPKFELVGLPDTAVKESKERIRSGIKNTGYVFPSKKLIINLAPANLRKEGPGYDLPIAVSIMAASGQVAMPGEDTIFIGELSFDV